MKTKILRLLSVLLLLFIQLHSATITWTGSKDTDWHKKCNWNPNSVPTCSDDVIIPSGTTNKPTISGIAQCKTIDVQTVAATLLTVSSTGSLEIGTCPSTKSEKRYVFVSSFAYSSNSSAATRDAACASDASTAGLCGTYKAWVSNAGANNVSNPGAGVAFYLPDGTTKVADDWTDLTDGALDNAINKYANGTAVNISVDVWTGLTSAGAAAANGATNCNGWATISSTGKYGTPSATNSFWTDNGVSISCQSVTYTLVGQISSSSGDCSCYPGTVYTGDNSCGGSNFKTPGTCATFSPPICCCGSCQTASAPVAVAKNHYCFQQ